MGWTPYHYVHQNPINLVDPTGMSAEPPEEGDFNDGDTHTDESGSWTYQNRVWYDNTGNDNNILAPIVINVDRQSSDNTIINGIPCVECHHKTSVPNGSINKLSGVVFWGDENTSFKAPPGSRDMLTYNIQFMLDLSDVFSPEVSDRLEKASELFKYIDFSPKPKATNSTKGNIDNSSTSSNDPNIIEADRYVYWQDDPWKKSPVSPHNAHKVKIYRHQRDSIKNENRKDSIRATKSR